MSRNAQRLAVIAVLVALIVGGIVAAVALTGDDDEQAGERTDVGQQSDTEETALSAAAGAAARAQRAAALSGANTTSDSATSSPAPTAGVADDAEGLHIDCGFGGEYVPSPEELAAANADTDALAATFDRYSVAYERNTDELGFTYVDYDYEDPVAEMVASSFYEQRYPPEPLSDEEMARNRAENDALTAAFDAAGVAYERLSDDAGWEWVEWDYDDAAAQAAAEGVYAELYPPVPLPAAELESIRAENDALAAAFDAAGVAYERLSDETGWEWVEWDYDDAAAQAVADAFYAERFPTEPCPEGGPAIDMPTEEPTDLPAEEVERIRAENDALAAAFDAAGVAYERHSEESGFEYLEYDYEDPAATEVADAFYAELFAPDPAEVAARDALVDALSAAFAAGGIDHEVRGEDAYRFVVFDVAAEAGPAAVDAARAAVGA